MTSWEDERADCLRMRARVNARVAALTGHRVATGPFAGMRLPEEAAWDDGNLGTKLAGSYEHELHRVIEVALRRDPATIINVGCAEGFYAVGLAMLAPQADVLALDVDPRARAICREAARLNGVTVRTAFGCRDPLQLAYGRDRRLLVVDCEGWELDLLDPALCPALARSDVIVECHDYMRERISGTLAERFERTHIVGSIEPRPPPVRSYPFLASLPFGVLMEAITEKRPPGTVWLVAWAR